MDCTTPRGRMWIARQDAIIEAFAGKWNMDTLATPTDSSARVDALFGKEGKLRAVAEVKARDLTTQQLTQYGDYLVTYDKLMQGQQVSALLQVPYFLIVGLYPQRIIAWWKLTTADGAWAYGTPPHRHTPTQATCNGGEAYRDNAYLPLAQAQTFHMDGQWTHRHMVP